MTFVCIAFSGPNNEPIRALWNPLQSAAFISRDKLKFSVVQMSWRASTWNFRAVQIKADQQRRIIHTRIGLFLNSKQYNITILSREFIWRLTIYSRIVAFPKNANYTFSPLPALMTDHVSWLSIQSQIWMRESVRVWITISNYFAQKVYQPNRRDADGCIPWCIANSIINLNNCFETCDDVD